MLKSAFGLPVLCVIPAYYCCLIFPTPDVERRCRLSLEKINLTVGSTAFAVISFAVSVSPLSSTITTLMGAFGLLCSELRQLNEGMYKRKEVLLYHWNCNLQFAIWFHCNSISSGRFYR